MDFIEPLPTSGGFDSILVVVDRLTKWAIFIPTTVRLTSPKLAQLIIDNVISQHGVPESIVSDRGSKFTSRFWGYVTSKLGVDLRLLTAYHPQTDGQTERVNQVLEQYIRMFGCHNQNDWSEKLGVASFVYNNSIHSATKYTPFFANFGYHPRWIDELQ
jgi:transposase InsO family protein